MAPTLAKPARTFRPTSSRARLRNADRRTKGETNMVELKPGARFQSTVCSTEVIVVKGAGEVDLTCGGAPMVASGSAEISGSPSDDAAGGTQLGKRYGNADETIELLATKAGDGSLAADGGALEIAQAKTLPPRTEPQPPMNLMMLLEMAAEGLGDRVAVGSLDDGLTYRQLYDAHGAANRYRAAGVESAVVCDESSPALPIALFGSAWAGIPYVPLNYRLPADDLLALAERAGSAVAIADESNLERLGGLPGVSSVSAEAFSADPAAGTDGHASPGDWNMDPDDLAVLLFTSGTTGSPKSAVLRHKHLVSYILGSVEFMGAGEDEATLVSVPPYHIAGVASMLSSVYAGRRIVQLPRFDPDVWIDTAEREGVTHAMVVPTMLTRIVDALDARGGAPMLGIRALSYGGGKMPGP